MILYGSLTSPYVRHCRIALTISGLESEFKDTDYAASAVGSPTQKVPFLADGDIKLTDSSSILLHIKQQSGQSFLQDVQELELYTMVNTVMDATINLFLLEKDGVTPENSRYLSRQAARIESGLKAMTQFDLSTQSPFNESEIRLGCFLDWAIFRKRISLDNYPELSRFLNDINAWAPFKETAPPSS